MKLLCDFCESNPASLICCADEAALCLHCDVQVHAANKIASKHERINLLGLPNNSKDSTSCDICQEKNGYFFCLEDRALLCRNCDFSIHTVNNIVSKHKRFVVMGTRVALHPLQAPTNHQTTTNASAAGISPPLISLMENPQTYSGQNPSFHCNVAQNIGQSPSFHSNSGQVYGGGEVQKRVINGQLINGINKESILLAAPKSSIGKYLTEIIPGWQVDELLTSPPQSLTTTGPDFSSCTPRSKDCASVRDVGFNGAPAEVPEMHSLELPCPSSIEMMMMTMRASHMHPYISLPPNTPHDNALQVPVLGVHHAHHSDHHNWRQ